MIWTSINWAKARLSDEKFSWNRKMQPKLKMIFCSEILIGLRRRQKSRLSWNDYRSILFLTPFNQDIRIFFTRLIIILFAKSKKYHQSFKINAKSTNSATELLHFLHLKMFINLVYFKQALRIFLYYFEFTSEKICFLIAPIKSLSTLFIIFTC